MTDKSNRKQLPGVIKDDLIGADEFRNSKIGYLSGYSAIKKSGTSILRPLGSGLSIIARSRHIFWPRRSVEKTYLSDIEDDKERFQEAMAKHERTQEDLISLEKHFRFLTIMYLMFVIAGAAWGFHVINKDHYDVTGPSSLLFPFFQLFLLVPLFFQNAFYYYQVRTRTLHSFKYFMKRPREWLPFKKIARVVSLAILAGLMLMAPGMAEAFSLTDTLSEHDLFYRMLQQIAPIGPVSPPLISSPWSEPLAAAFRAFNTALLTVGSMMLGWHTLAGTIASAHEGQVLGQRWHMIWAPLRSATGIASLAPVANGYCAAQVLVIQLIVWGGGIANGVWGSYIDFMSNPASVERVFAVDDYEIGPREIAEIGNNVAAREMILGVLANQTCLRGVQLMHIKAIEDWNTNRRNTTIDITDIQANPQAYHAALNDAFGSPGFLGWGRSEYAGTGLTAAELLVNGAAAGRLVGIEDTNMPFLRAGQIENPERGEIPVKARWDYGKYCGSIEIDLLENSLVDRLVESNSGHADAQVIEAQTRILNEHIYDLTDNVITRFDSEVIPLVNEVVDIMVAAAEGVQESYAMLEQNAEAEQLLAEAYAIYRSIMAQTTGQYIERVDNWLGNGVDTNELFETMRARGWAAGGTFYVLLAKLQEMYWSLGNYTPTMTTSNLELLKDEHDHYVRWLDGADGHSGPGLIPVYNEFIETAVSNTGDALLDAMFEPSSAEASVMFKLLNTVLDDVFDIALNVMNPDPYNAMLSMQELGNKTISIIIVAIAGILTVSTGTAVVGGIIGGMRGIPIVGSIAGGAIDGAISALAGPVSSVVFVVKLAIFILFSVGVMHAFILPMMPYVLMTFFVMGMMILVAEALIAAPIWAFFHVRLDGQDFVDQVQKPGYMIAFNLLLRPSLAVFGLILSYGLFGSIIWFIHETFAIAGKSVMMGNVGVIGRIVMIIIMTYLHYQVAVRSFTLITQVPDRVTRWFGQSGENLGEGSDAERSTTAIVAGIGTRTESLARGSAKPQQQGDKQKGGSGSSQGANQTLDDD